MTDDIQARFEFEVASAEQFSAGLLDQVRARFDDEPDEPRDVSIALVTTNLYNQLSAANLATLAALLLVRTVESERES